jgi:hypothetical protein
MAHVAWTSTGDSRFRGGVAAARRVPARSPLALGLLVLLWVVGAASGALLSGPSTGLRDLVGAGLGPVSPAAGGCR